MMNQSDKYNKHIEYFQYLMNNSQYARAICHMESIRFDQQENWNYFYLYALPFRFMNNFNQAIIYNRRALDILLSSKVDKYRDKNLANIKLNLGICYQLKEDFSNSIKFLKESIKHNEYRFEAYNSLGLTYSRMDDLSEANKTYSLGLNKLFDSIYIGIDNIPVGVKNTWPLFTVKDDDAPVFSEMLMHLTVKFSAQAGCQTITMPTPESAIKFYNGQLEGHPNDIGVLYRDIQEGNKKTRLVFPSYHDYMYNTLRKDLLYSTILNNLGVVKRDLGDSDLARKRFNESILFIPPGIEYETPYYHLKRL